MYPKRYLHALIERLVFSHNKMCFISGPRQVGKTTMARALLQERGKGAYWNWDDTRFRRLWARDPSSVLEEDSTAVKRIIVLDEIHKAKGWKRTLKGIYDTLESPVDLLVTGSARLDVYKKGSDSLMGRYVPLRLHPFSVGELLNNEPPSPDEFYRSLLQHEGGQERSAEKHLKQLLVNGGFPEPYFSGDPDYLNVWRRTRVERLVREDLRDLSRLPELSQIEMLVALLPERAGQVLSRQSLREDLEVAYTTVSRWLTYLAALYYHFEIRPFATRIKNAIRHEGKLYLWDYSEVPDPGARFENLVASHLLKACHYWTDSGKGKFDLCYLRNKAGREIDFLITRDRKAWLPIEVKCGEQKPSSNWRIFMPQLGCDFGVQLLCDGIARRSYEEGGKKVCVLSAGDFLKGLP